MLGPHLSKLEAALAHYSEKYKSEQERWGIVRVLPVLDPVNTFDLADVTFRYLSVVTLGEKTFVVCSDEHIPRPAEVCKLWDLVTDLESGFATEADLDDYDGPYKREF